MIRLARDLLKLLRRHLRESAHDRTFIAWHVRFFSPSLKHEMLSPELATEEDAFEEAWKLAENGEAVTAVEGPDGEIGSTDEVDLWFRERGREFPPRGLAE